ncbi:MAG: SpoIIE family protein phosphatase [bacterium]
MLRRPIKEISAEFSAEEKYLDSIQRTVREACVAAGIGRKDVSAVLLATEEGATNIIRHAYLYEKGLLRLRIVIYPKMVVFSLIDFGRSFQPDQVGNVDLEHLVASGRKGGLGFYMIRKIMDSVQYISSADRNELRMIKRIGKKRSGGPMLNRMLSLRVKFSFWTFFIVFFIVAGAFYYMDRQTTRQLYDRLDRTVSALMKTIADQTQGYLSYSRSAVEFDELVVSYMRANPEFRTLVLVDGQGSILAHSEDARRMGMSYQVPDQIDGSLVGVPQHYAVASENLNYLIVPIVSGRRQLGQVHVVYSSKTISTPLADARRRIVVLTSLLFVFGIVGIYMLSNYFVRPIANITRRVRRFASGDLESELPLEGAEEFFEISKAFNEIMTRLSQDRKNIAAREKMAREIEVASQIQRTLLPTKLPDLPGLELDAFYRAASVVGGDLYDVFRIGPDRYCLTVADVSGKGVPASLLMSMLRTVIRISAQEATSARDVLLKVNDFLSRNMPSGMFITIMLVVYETKVRRLNLVSAGHNALLLYRAQTGRTEQINPAGMPLGMPDTLDRGFAESLTETTVQLNDSDHFLIFTDGLSEAVDREGRQFGLDRLQGLFGTSAAGHRSQDISRLAQVLIAELDDFAGFTKANDDITFLVARATDAHDELPPDKPEAASVLTIEDTDPGPQAESGDS